MRILGFNINRSKPKKAIQAEVGGTGTSFYSGTFSNVDYNAKMDVSTSQGIDTVNEMVFGDSTVKSALNIIELPLKRAKWVIECEDEDMKEFLEQSLFYDMNRSWQELLDEILDYLPYGHAVFEKVFMQTEKGVQWYKWGTRLQDSIWRWQTEDGEPGIQQRLLGEEATDKGSTPSIPADKLIVFTNEQKGADVTGQSILRSAYKNFYMKTQIEKIDAIAHERQGIGVPVIRLPGAFNTKDKTQAKNIAENWRANEQAYVVLPGGPEGQRWEFDVMNMKAESTRDPHKSIQYHDRQILKSVLAQFINLGAITAGTRNVADVQSEIFFLSVEAIGQHICNVINKYAIEELVNLNFGAQEEYPQLKVKNVRQEDTTKLATALGQLLQFGALQMDDNLEEHLRELFRLPERDEESVRETTQPEGDTAEEPAMSEEIEEDPEAMNASMKFSIKPRANKLASNREKVFLKNISKFREDLEREYLETLKPIYEEYQSKVINTLSKGYANAETKIQGGVEVLKNGKDRTKLIKKVNNVEKKFRKKLLSKKVRESLHEIAVEHSNKAVKELMDTDMKFAKKTIGQLQEELQSKSKDPVKRLLPDLEKAFDNKDFEEAQRIVNQIPDDSFYRDAMQNQLDIYKRRAQGQAGYADLGATVSMDNAKSMIRLYKYNIEAWFDRELRHIKENIEDNFVGLKSQFKAMQDALNIEFSESYFRLSTLTHPEALFRNNMFRWGFGAGIIHYKAVLPEDEYDQMTTDGMTQSVLYRIYTKEQWDEKLENADNVVGSMGIHHNSRVFFYPVSMLYLDEEEEISRKQIKILNEEIKNAKS